MKHTLVLLPGMMCDERVFAPQVAQLGHARDIVVPDYGLQETIDAMAAHVLASIDSVRFDLAGFSMGGMVALSMTRLAPHRVRRLALVGTSHLPEPADNLPVREKRIADALAGGLREIMNAAAPHYLAAANAARCDLLEVVVAMGMDIGPAVYAAQARALRDRPDQTAALGAWPGATLVIAGEEDVICPPDCQRQVAGLLDDARLVLVPDAGHLALLEQPEAVNHAMSEWLARPT